MDLNTLWFVLLGVLLTGYATLDGFDLGIGVLQPVAKADEERRILLNSIGPIWDGNEVWLVSFGGAMFAAFGESYATVFSGFYIAFMLNLFALILRAISIEFRSKTNAPARRQFWDYGFCFASLLAAMLFGTAVSAAMNGVPRATKIFVEHQWAWLVVILNILAIANIPRAIWQSRPAYAFISSSATIAALVCLFGMALFSNLVTSRPIENSLTIYNSASSHKTLVIMTVIAAIGMPFVATYTCLVYWSFRGKVQLKDHSYWAFTRAVATALPTTTER